MLHFLFAQLALFADFDWVRSLGAALVGAGIFGTVAAGRWLKARSSGGSTTGGAVTSGGASSAMIALVMAVGLGIIFTGVFLMTMNR